MKQPGFGVQARTGRVIRDADVCAGLLEILQCSEFGRSGVGGGEYAQASPDVAMAVQQFQQRADAGPSNKCHQHVDPIGGWNFGA